MLQCCHLRLLTHGVGEIGFFFWAKMKKSDGTVSLIQKRPIFLFVKEYVHHLDSYLWFYSICLLISALSMNAACWPAVYCWQAVYLAGIICLQAVDVGRRNMSADSIQYVSWQYMYCVLAGLV